MTPRGSTRLAVMGLAVSVAAGVFLLGYATGARSERAASTTARRQAAVWAARAVNAQGVAASAESNARAWQRTADSARRAADVFRAMRRAPSAGVGAAPGVRLPPVARVADVPAPPVTPPVAGVPDSLPGNPVRYALLWHEANALRVALEARTRERDLFRAALDSTVAALQGGRSVVATLDDALARAPAPCRVARVLPCPSRRVAFVAGMAATLGAGVVLAGR